MAFKKTARHVPAKEPEYIPDPNQINLLDQIAEINEPADINVAQLSPDGVVKWNGNPIEHNHSLTCLGIIVAAYPFNPLGVNTFGLMFYDDKLNQGYRRVTLLNQDLSPKVAPNGYPQKDVWSLHGLAFIGYANG